MKITSIIIEDGNIATVTHESVEDTDLLVVGEYIVVSEAPGNLDGTYKVTGSITNTQFLAELTLFNHPSTSVDNLSAKGRPSELDESCMAIVTTTLNVALVTASASTNYDTWTTSNLCPVGREKLCKSSDR